MTTVFVDTSALYAVVDADDRSHERAGSEWNRLVDSLEAGAVRAVTHSGVVMETISLLQRRLGVMAVRSLNGLVLPVIEVEWVGQALHDRAMTALLAADRREVSLVDWTSFELMRAAGIRTAFAFDDDFARQGFAPW